MKLIFKLVILIFTTSLIACTQEVTKVVTQTADPTTPPTVPGSEANGGANPAQPTPGGGDVGGGNGLCGRPIESYAFKLKDLPAYQKFLKPIGEHLAKLDKDEDSKSKSTDSLLSLARSRTWYFSCVELETLEKSKIGVEFLKGSTDQLAVQTDREVYIDEKKWAKMEESEQADLILHELMMAAYMFRFMTFQDICVLDERCDFESLAQVMQNPKFRDFFAAEEKRPLRSEDYENIRAATVELRSNYKEILTQEQFRKGFYRKHRFDRRFYSDPLGTATIQEKLKEVKIKYSEIKKLLELHAKAKNLPSICKDGSKCNLSLKGYVPNEKDTEMWSEEDKDQYSEVSFGNAFAFKINDNELNIRLTNSKDAELDLSKNLGMCPSGDGLCFTINAIQFFPADFRPIVEDDTVKFLYFFIQANPVLFSRHSESGVAEEKYTASLEVNSIFMIDMLLSDIKLQKSPYRDGKVLVSEQAKGTSLKMTKENLFWITKYSDLNSFVMNAWFKGNNIFEFPYFRVYLEDSP